MRKVIRMLKNMTLRRFIEHLKKVVRRLAGNVVTGQHFIKSVKETKQKQLDKMYRNLIFCNINFKFGLALNF